MPDFLSRRNADALAILSGFLFLGRSNQRRSHKQ